MAGLPNIKSCPVCHQVYLETGQGMCRKCYEEKEEKAKIVIRYVRDHPNANMEEIVEATEVDMSIVKMLIKEGRLEEVGMPYTYPCARCGKKIFQGKLCNSCKESLHKSLQKAQEKIKANKDKEKKYYVEFLRNADEGSSRKRSSEKTKSKKRRR